MRHKANERRKYHVEPGRKGEYTNLPIMTRSG
jgi:hypothetical protein